MVLVSLNDFLRSGTLGSIGLGVPRVQVRLALGDPPTQSTVNRRQRLPMTWKYGDVELSFDGDDDRLVSIYLDNFGVPCGAGGLALDPWVLRGGLPSDEAEAALRAAGIGFLHRPWPMSPPDVLLVTQADVRLGFIREPDEFGPPVGLHHIARSTSSYD